MNVTIQQIFEQSRLASEYGAAINVAPNALGVLLRLGVDPAEAGAVDFKWFTEYSKTGDYVKVNDFAARSGIWQHRSLLAHRVDLHAQLKTAATSVSGAGTPVKLVTSARVVDVGIHDASITLEDGSSVKGDMVIGADGVHSKTRAKLTKNVPFPSGKSAFRFTLKKSDVLAHPKAAEIVQREGEMVFWFDVSRRIVMYPTRHNEILNFVCLHPDSGDSAEGDQTWIKPGSRQELLKTFEGFDERALAMLAMADESTLKVWKLMDMEPIEQWSENRFCLLGDAAHPFLPHQGQGGAQAIEDGVCLGVLLPLGTEPHEIPDRLRLYQRCRQERANTVQEATRQSGADISDEKTDKGAKVLQFFYYNWGHDEYDHSSQKLRDWLYKEKSQVQWQMPLSFGPFPGPRQDVHGRLRKANQASFITRSVKFKTSRTILQNLLPTPAYKFEAPDTFATASYVHTKFEGLDWLGGQGYSSVSLHLHGVQYKKKDGTIDNGDYLVVTWADIADSITKGREEIGLPKLFAEIDTQKTTSTWTMQASSRKSSFLTLELHDLEERPASDAPANDANLAYKYIPALGNPGVSDVEYPVLVPASESTRVTKFQKAANCSIKLDAQDEKKLPTLHHVITRLAELPVYEILEGTFVEGIGVQDMSSAYRIE
ncbi:hypothetical protein H2200_005896 [Cladophialophora chaetospira]|uniref:FAD-binding domain-containing protein n=1 Tax=Cladophialophora chaetospira TaxID=386627 RepID=A0AA39CIL5_9EURO|nr:hypothetical protein H2200_005896 [Cladophialophora chaetospira]